jgi:hypothetical protein
LGHIILEQGIAVDPKKIEAIRGWSTPMNVSEVIYFMGLARYYMRFIEGLSIIPLSQTPTVNVNENVLKLVSCLISFCTHLPWDSAHMYCALKK